MGLEFGRQQGGDDTTRAGKTEDNDRRNALSPWNDRPIHRFGDVHTWLYIHAIVLRGLREKENKEKNLGCHTLTTIGSITTLA